MRPIDRNTQLDPASGIVTSNLSPETQAASSTPSPAVDQPALPPDPATIAGKRLERDLEAAFYKGSLDKAGAGPGGVVLYDKSAKPDGNTGTEVAGSVHEAAPVRVADAGDELNMGVRAAAGHLVGQKVVGTGECYDLADAVLRDAGAKSAPDFGKVTKSRDQDYKWGTKIDLKDAKPGDILQFRNHQVVVSVVKKTTKTYPDGHSATTIDKNSTPYKRGQHTSIVLSNDGSGQIEYVRGLLALSRRDFRDAARNFGLSELQGRTGVRSLLVYSLCLAGERATAAQLSQNIEPTDDDLRHFWGWIHARFGVGPA